MKVSGVLSIGSILPMLWVSGYNQPIADEVDLQASAGFFECREPRPEICYDVFAPVCAVVRDPQIRCITTPCPSELQVTYVNDCRACADTQVSGYQQGACQ